ncbi:MAG: hypothetical protein ABIN01_00355 [Ferruginibacter sp.]
MKFFDVDWDAASGRAVPVAKLLVQDKVILEKYHIVPAVFIVNDCILKIDSLQAISLAGKIYTLINDIAKSNGISRVDEIQIDCDWTQSTGKKYFSLLQTIRQLSKCNISATIRLHQVKYLSKSGVPPVDRGLLMCYNMGNLKNPDTKNSIIESSELMKYTANLSTYPLPLDVALPLFEWKVLFRNNIYKGLIEDLPDNAFTNAFAVKNGWRIEILKDTLLAGYHFEKGDMLRNERSDIKEVLAAANEIKKHIKNSHFRVALYHLDSLTLNKFTTNELESIYGVFR